MYTQTVEIQRNNNFETVHLPNPNDYLFDNLKWGSAFELFTPAYWKLQIIYFNEYFKNMHYRTGETFLEEVIYCLLGGFGMKAEIGYLFFKELKYRGIINEYSSIKDKKIIFNILNSPISLNGKKIRYRFPATKSEYIFNVFKKLNTLNHLLMNL